MLPARSFLSLYRAPAVTPRRHMLQCAKRRKKRGELVEMSDSHEQPQRTPDITIEDFEKVDIRIGRVLSAEPLEGARTPAYKLRIDFGPQLGVKQSSAQL